MSLRYLCAPALVAGLVAAFPLLLSAQEMPARIKGTRAAPDAGWTLAVNGGTGFGVFQDVQVPINQAEGMRADGKSPGVENASHTGMPLHAGFAVRTGHLASGLYELDADFLMMRATTGPAETQSSSYSRMAVAGGGRVALADWAWRPVASGHVIVRRSSFNNVSNAHFADAAIARAGLGLIRGDGALDLYAGYAPWARFGFNAGRGFGGEAFKQSKTTVTEVGLRYARLVAESVWIDLGLEQERVQVRLDDVQEYAAFGLTVGPTAQRARVYDLATSTARIGFRKEL